VDEETKRRRHDQLMELQQDISRRKHRALIGREFDVLVEGYSEETELLLTGRNSQQAPEIDGVTYINDGTADVGDLVRVKITDAMDYDLVGSIVARPQ
jgi:ribosomal protein S12 methylthiotransferase